MTWESYTSPITLEGTKYKTLFLIANLKEFRECLLVGKITLCTNNKSLILTCLFEKKNNNNRKSEKNPQDSR